MPQQRPEHSGSEGQQFRRGVVILPHLLCERADTYPTDHATANRHGVSVANSHTFAQPDPNTYADSHTLAQPDPDTYAYCHTLNDSIADGYPFAYTNLYSHTYAYSVPNPSANGNS